MSLSTLKIRRPTILVAIILAIGTIILLSYHDVLHGFTVGAWDKLISSSSNPFLARMYCETPQKYIIPDSYIVYLRRGYSLDKHKQAVGNGVDLDMENVFCGKSWHGPCYKARMGKDVLGIVRSDAGVDAIECSRRLTPDELPSWH